jgi:hypothetical protein
MPLMPIPPIPMKWMGPISRGSFMLVPRGVSLREAQISRAGYWMPRFRGA